MKIAFHDTYSDPNEMGAKYFAEISSCPEGGGTSFSDAVWGSSATSESFHWSASYVGLPWVETGDAPDGVSCWGLCVLVYREVLGIALPSYTGLCACPAERRQIAATIGGEASSALWHPAPLTAACEFDVAVFRVGELDAHVGLICTPTQVLHITQGHDSAVLDLRESRWVSRFSGLYRHAEMMGRPRAA